MSRRATATGRLMLRGQRGNFEVRFSWPEPLDERGQAAIVAGPPGLVADAARLLVGNGLLVLTLTDDQETQEPNASDAVLEVASWYRAHGEELGADPTRLVFADLLDLGSVELPPGRGTSPATSRHARRVASRRSS